METNHNSVSPTNKTNSPENKTVEGPKQEDISVKKRKFLNGWTPELDDLMAEWADKAACYRWMHERTEKRFSRNNSLITIPVIILSTLTGTANVGITSIFGDDQTSAQYATLAIGGVSILTGIIQTVGNFLRYAQGSEAHRVSSVSWGKFNRLITVELRLNPNERMDSMSFLKICRVELDRLIEQSPPIPDSIIKDFRRNFGKSLDVKQPDNVAPIEHTKAFKDSNARLKRIAAEAAIMLHHKKGVLKQMVVSDIDIRIKEENERMKAELKPMLEQIAKKAAADTMRNHKFKRHGSSADNSSSREVSPDPPISRRNLTSLQSQKADEIKKELSEMTSKGVVSMLRNQFKDYPSLPIQFPMPPSLPAEDDDDDSLSETNLPETITIHIIDEKSGGPSESKSETLAL
jgi:hypothetical protein